MKAIELKNLMSLNVENKIVKLKPKYLYLFSDAI